MSQWCTGGLRSGVNGPTKFGRGGGRRQRRARSGLERATHPPPPYRENDPVGEEERLDHELEAEVLPQLERGADERGVDDEGGGAEERRVVPNDLAERFPRPPSAREE